MKTTQSPQHDQLDDLLNSLAGVGDEMAEVIVGQQEVVRQLQVALLAGGHCLLEGVPGLAKTLMVQTLARCLDLSFTRIQFTPDLMPADLIGTEILRRGEDGSASFEYQPGPVFTQVLLADEINRTPPKTQAALLEAMSERSVSYAGETRLLPAPFFVLATQNPLEQAGTYPLPEAQLDRFLLLLNVAYPSHEEELAILNATTGNREGKPQALLNAEQVLTLQSLARDVVISETLVDYAARLVRATRPGQSKIAEVDQYLRWGAGPRAGQALVLTAKATALLDGRFAVTEADLRANAGPVLRHRLLPNFHAQADGVTADDLVEAVVRGEPRPASPLD
ncbi:MAG: MoxR family ATPase [Pseudomonadota bacterium]